jgi:hypothetical protein
MNNIPDDLPKWLVDMIELKEAFIKSKHFKGYRVIEITSIDSTTQCTDDIEDLLNSIEKPNVNEYSEIT